MSDSNEGGIYGRFLNARQGMQRRAREETSDELFELQWATMGVVHRAIRFGMTVDEFAKIVSDLWPLTVQARQELITAGAETAAEATDKKAP